MCVACVAAAGLGLAAPAHDAAGPFPGDDGPLPWPEGAPRGGRMRWTGVAGFRFDLDERSVAFDPFVTRPGAWRVLFGRARSDEDAVRSRFADLDAVFVGHTHFDHAMDLPAVAAASPRAVIHGSRVTVELCRRLGVPAARLRTVRDGERFAVGPFAVEAVAARHGVVPLVRFVDRIELPAHGVPRTPFRYPRGDVFSWRLTAGDRSFFLQGSAGIHQPALDRQAPADVLVACLAARRGTPRYFERLGERLRPALLVPCHHDDFFRPLTEAPHPVPTLRWSAFLADAEAIAAAYGTRTWRPPWDRPVTW